VQTPTADYRKTDFRKPKELFKGLDAGVYALIGMYKRRSTTVSKLLEQAERIDDLAPQYKHLTNHQLQQRLFELREKFRRGIRD
jgi:preprotein translocase subunit SecA